MTQPDVGEAWRRSTDHRAEIERSGLCGCFHCARSFPPAKVASWADEPRTAICPKCGVDAVIGDASGFPVTDKDFLRSVRASGGAMSGLAPSNKGVHE